MHERTYNGGGEFEWDIAKAAANYGKHGVDFAEASDVFYDSFAVTFADEYPFEERFVTMGVDTTGRLLVVAFTWRADTIRIISARPATKSERKRYEDRI